MAGCPGSLSWSWEPQGGLARDARREKGEGLFTSLAPFLFSLPYGGCISPQAHGSTQAAHATQLLWARPLWVSRPRSCASPVVSSQLLRPLYIFYLLSFPQITW